MRRLLGGPPPGRRFGPRWLADIVRRSFRMRGTPTLPPLLPTEPPAASDRPVFTKSKLSAALLASVVQNSDPKCHQHINIPLTSQCQRALLSADRGPGRPVLPL